MKMNVVKNYLSQHGEMALKHFFKWYQLQRGNLSIRRTMQTAFGRRAAQRNSVENHTIVIKAMCDLMTDYHPNATIVERFSLAFAEKRWLEDTCRENWNQGKLIRSLQNITKYEMFKLCTLVLYVCKWMRLHMWNTYLIFAGWVEGIDNSSSSHPPE